jgi:hypothetical protein
MSRRFTLTLPVDLCALAEARAQKEGRTIANLIRQAMRAYLAKPTTTTAVTTK